MKSEAGKENEKQQRPSDRSAGFAEDIRPLHDCACYFISLAQTWLERITHSPFPIGPIIGWAEDLVDRWTYPLTQAARCHSLSILASIDDQIFCLVEGCGLCSKVQLKAVLSQLYTQGLVSTSAGLWTKYELALKEDIRKAVTLAGQVPLINVVTPIFLYLVTPSARAVSDWLSKQGERRLDESTRTGDSILALISKQDVANEGQGIVISKSVCDVQYEGHNVLCVHSEEGFSEGKCLRVDDAVKDNVLHGKEDTNAGCAEGRLVRVDDVEKDDVPRATKDSKVDVVVKDDVLHAKEDTVVDEVPFKQIDVSVDGMKEEDIFCGTNVDKAVPASEKIVLSQVAEEVLPDVLEMLESSWLLGTSAFSKVAPNPSSSGFHRRRNG